MRLCGKLFLIAAFGCAVLLRWAGFFARNAYHEGEFGLRLMQFLSYDLDVERSELKAAARRYVPCLAFERCWALMMEYWASLW
jgi:hypothetical protein